MPQQVIITICAAVITVILAIALVPVSAQAQGLELDVYDMMDIGGTVSGDESCDTSSEAGFTFFYDVAYRMSESEALLLMDRLGSREAQAAYIDEDAVTLAQRLYKSADYYEKTVANCLVNESLNENNVSAVEICACKDETALLDLRKAYHDSISAYPEWAGAVLKIPGERRGHNFVAIAQYDPVKMGENCAAYIAD